MLILIVAVNIEASPELEELMERYADGDQRAFSEMYDRLRPVIFGRAARKVGPEIAEDIVQATFLKLHANRRRYRTGTALLPWIFTISDRLLIDSFRRRGRDQSSLTDDGVLPEVGVVDEPVDPLLSEAVRAAVETLPEYQRDVVVMHFFEGKDLAEVARNLGLEPSTVRVRKHRAGAALRKKLGDLIEGR